MQPVFSVTARPTLPSSYAIARARSALRRRSVGAAFGLCVAAAACSPKGPAGPVAPHEEAPIDVEVAQVKEQPVASWTPVTGTLISEQRTQLSANASGRVVQTCVERGQAVQQDQVLLILDVRQARHVAVEAKANLRNVQAQRATTEQDCRRYEALWHKKAISQQEYEQRMLLCQQLAAQFDGAEARAHEAARTLGDGQVRAPFAGIVSERAVQVGDYVQQASPVVTLVKPDPLRLRCAVPESQAAYVKSGNKLQFRVAAFPERDFAGSVRYVSGEVREASRDIVFEAIVPNPEHTLLAGMFATGRLYGPPQPKPVVPTTCLIAEGDKQAVFLLDEGHLRRHVVRVGETMGDVVVIEDGLHLGDVVVLHAKPELRDGQPAAQES